MIDLKQQFDVIVVGGGHAGTEAALASARMGASTLLLTHQIETLGQMSCNPAIGGIGKGHLVKEIDAMGGIMAKAADHAGIHFRVLNSSKGKAVRATRAQADRLLYKQFVRKALENQPNLLIFQQPVDDLLIENHRVTGVRTQSGLEFRARSVVLTAGTFLAGKIHIGLKNYEGGRAGDPASVRLAERLRDLPFRVGRLKTGTPPRIDGRTIQYDLLEKQSGDTPRPVFSFTGSERDHPEQVDCHIAHTSELTHDIIRAGLSESPLYAGVIEGTGPRYCPSIEDKIVRFSHKSSHQIFIEPEGLTTHEVYPNGISTSLPFSVQMDLVRSMKGFERAHLTRPGYAIEYDFFDPRDLKPSLETKAIHGLFFAGQINGTTGYEEAAAQGLIAGMNAVLYTRGEPSWTPRRDEAYMGVLIDDLTTLGTLEPYRMFTSRAEFRLLLREDNADQRLSKKAYDLHLIDAHRYRIFSKKMEEIEQGKKELSDTILRVDSASAARLTELSGEEISREQRLNELLKRPRVCFEHLLKVTDFNLSDFSKDVWEQVEIEIKYAGYIDRQNDEVERLKRYESLEIPVDFDYDNVRGLSHEVCQKLKSARPLSIGSASRISGVTPASISLLLVHLKR